jgi:hypothetical protein
MTSGHDAVYAATLHLGTVIPPTTQGDFILLSFLSCLALCLVSHPLSLLLTHSYAKLSAIDKRTWCIGIVRGVAGVVIGVASIPIFTCPVVSVDTIRGATDYSRMWVAILVGFFIFELLSLLWVAIFFNYRNFPLWYHHIGGILFVGSVMW